MAAIGDAPQGYGRQEKSALRLAESPVPPTAGEILAQQRRAFLAEGIPDAKTRVSRILRLQAMLLDHADELCTALAEDFGTRPRELSLASDIVGSMSDLDRQRKNVKKWMKTEKVSPAMGLAGLRFGIRHDPKGVVGVMGAWNYPLKLVAVPGGAAFAAGNRVMLRPSSVTARTAQVLADIAPRYFAADELAVITREQATGEEFAKLPFDHLFFTGSPEVGASVAREAVSNLAPVTLELGGKNPVVVDDDADLGRAASRIADARLMNSGQVCMCPDYVFVPAAKRDDFISAVLARWMANFPQVADNDQYTAIVDDKNYTRIIELIADAERLGATVHRATPEGEPTEDAVRRKIVPTVLTDVTPEMRVEDVEIFGPVLVVHTYREIDEASAYISSRPSPLTLYWYGPNNQRFRTLQSATRSGSVNANEAMLNVIVGDLPFGGVGSSGMGNYHGKFGFQTFSHARAVAYSALPFSVTSMGSAPFGRWKTSMFDRQLASYRRNVGRARRRSSTAD